MNRDTRRRLRRLPLALLLGALLGAMPLARPVLAQNDGEIAGWKNEFKNAPKTDAVQARAAYSALLDKLLPGMSNPDYATQARTQDAWEKVAVNAGRPGAEVERAAVVQLILGHIGANEPQLTRVWMLKQLEHIGRADAVPALAALINDPDIVARGRVLRALASNPSPEAGQALRDALGKATTPEMKVALINELGYRQEVGATAQLTPLLAAGDDVAIAAASALGRIGNNEAAQALVKARPNAQGNFKIAVLDAYLRAADSQAKNGNAASAALMYQDIWKSAEPSRTRVSGLRGLAMTRGVASLPVLLEQVGSDDPFLQLTATRLLVEAPGLPVSTALAKQLGGMKPATQAVVVSALAERGDAVARPGVLALTKSTDESVRLAAIRGLATLGDANDVVLLSQMATEQTALGKAAQDSLNRLKGEPVNVEMVKVFQGAKPEVRAILATSLAARRAPNAAAAMLAAAEKGAPTERVEAIKAVGVLGDEKVVPNLVRLLSKAPDDAVRTATQNALRDIIDNRTQDKVAAGQALATGLATADSQGKRALLTLMKSSGGDPALTAVKVATKDADADVQDAAVRALIAWPETTAVPALMELAANTPKPNYHALALQGAVRLSALPAYTSDERINLLKDVIANAKRPDEKRGALAALGKVPDASVLDVVTPLLDNADLREEAALSAISAAKIAPMDKRKAAMQKVIETSKNADTIKTATDLMNAPSTVRPWQILGPFAGDGFDKDFGVEKKVELDKVFTAANNQKTRWKVVTSDAQNGYVNLLEQFDPKENATAYALIYVKSPSDRAARLTAGSDDGAKIWLNGKQIVANNAARPANPGDEQKDVQLKAGWNEVLFKITQGGGDWGYFFDLQTPDKKPMADLIWAAKPN